MVLVGDAVFGAGNGRTFMLFEAFTVFLALVGSTSSASALRIRIPSLAPRPVPP